MQYPSKPFYLACALTVLSAGATLAQEADTAHSSGNQPSSASAGGNPQETSKDSFWQQSQLLGDMGGMRPFLENYGISLALTETGEYFDNARGGIRRGGNYDGLTTLTLQMDTKKAFGWEGGLFNVSGLDIHGSNFSNKKLGDLQTASGIEADNTARLWELWYQQTFADSKTDVKIGQQSIDQEFMVSSNALLFINTALGWSLLPSADLIAGGPAYPLSSPGIRLRTQPSDSVTLLGGVFDDNPPGLCPLCTEDPQRLNDRGTNFRLSDAPLLIAEMQYSRPGNGDMQRPGQSDILPGTYRLGGWYDFGHFADQEFGTDGLPLSISTGNPKLHHGNYSIYAVADQMVWKPSAAASNGLNLFARVMGAPTDRNLIDFGANAGATYKGLIPSRDDDTFGVSYGLANISSSVSNLELQGGIFPVQTKEQFIEVTYQAQLLPWIQIQPDFQYVFNPGAGALDATGTLKNEAIFGIRTNITF